MPPRLTVQHIPYNTTADDLRALFETRGDVVSVELPRDHVTGQLKGYAIVEMGSLAQAEDAAAHLNHVEFGGRRLRVRFSGVPELADAAPELEVEPPHPGEHAPPPRPERPERKATQG